MRILTGRVNTRKFESQFTLQCNAWADKDCSKRATWAAWSAHSAHHREWCAYCCDECKGIAENRFEQYEGKRCVCGYTVEGTIDQHLRFIRL